jgi:hypothetical protein
MPAPSRVGDLAVWYSGDRQQKFVAYGWVCGLPHKPEGEQRKYYGPACGVMGLPPGSKSRAEVGASSGFMADADEVIPMAQTVTHNHSAFLLALGFSPRFVDGREHISAEIARCIETAGGLNDRVPRRRHQARESVTACLQADVERVVFAATSTLL